MNIQKLVMPDTKIDKDAVAIRTQLTMDFKEVSDTDILGYAIDALVVKWQAKVRRAGHVPAEDTYIVPKLGTRAMQTPEQSAERLTIEQLEAILAKKKVIVRKNNV